MGMVAFRDTGVVEPPQAVRVAVPGTDAAAAYAAAEHAWCQHDEAHFPLMELSSPIGQDFRINRDLSHGLDSLYENHARFCAVLLGGGFA